MSPKYIFIDIVFFFPLKSNFIRCPCLKCGNIKKLELDDVRAHLYFNGIDQSYKEWIFHGEETRRSANFQRQKSRSNYASDYNDNPEVMVEDAEEQLIDDPTMFNDLLSDAKKPLYQGCDKYTNLSTLVELYIFEARNNLSDKGFSELHDLLKKMLP